MQKQDFLRALKIVKEQSPKRNFKQTIDLIINFKGLDLKKPDNQLDFYLQLHFPRGKKVKVCGFVGGEVMDEAKAVLDGVVDVEEFPKYQANKAMTKKLGSQYDVFISLATIMPKVAATFGRVLGPKQKMPNPKAGCVVPPNPAAIRPLYDKLQKQIKVSVKTSPLFQCGVGTEDMNEEEMVENMLSIFTQVLHHLPDEKNNIKSVFLKTTMGPPIQVIEEQRAATQAAKKKKVILKHE